MFLPRLWKRDEMNASLRVFAKDYPRTLLCLAGKIVDGTNRSSAKIVRSSRSFSAALTAKVSSLRGARTANSPKKLPGTRCDQDILSCTR